MARSLLDDSRFDSIGRGKQSKSGGGNSADKVKLTVAIALFALAGGVLAWYYDLIPGMGSKPPQQVITPEEKQAFETQEKQRQQQIQRGEVIVGGD